jgi:hypothetical protein
LHCHLVIPALLPPPESADEFIAGAAAPALMRLIARASDKRWLPANYETWWCERYGVARQIDWPLAPVAYAADGGTPDDGYWLRADPVNLQVNRDQLLLTDADRFPIDDNEAQALLSALNTHFGREGLRFLAPHPKRWYLRVPDAPDVSCASLEDVAGRSINLFMPKGRDAARFRSLVNEAQMLLYVHGVNEQREAAGELTVNSIWLSGGGRMPMLQTPVHNSIWASDTVARSFGLAGGSATAPLPADAPAWLARMEGSSEHVVTVHNLRAALQYADRQSWQEALTALENEWVAPLTTALQTGKITRLSLTGFGADRSIHASATRKDTWKFWRGSGSTATLVKQ